MDTKDKEIIDRDNVLWRLKDAMENLSDDGLARAYNYYCSAGYGAIIETYLDGTFREVE
jgi:hypothetical protein